MTMDKLDIQKGIIKFKGKPKGRAFRTLVIAEFAFVI